jgi:hypothetical protein
VSDQLFHKRKKRRTIELARRREKRERSTRVLVVSEGAETEPNYIGGLCAPARRNGLLADILAPGPTDLVGLINSTDKILRCDADYDNVFVVADYDENQNVGQSLDNILALSRRRRVRITPVLSCPCFEYWLLLHFEECSAPMNAQQALDRLRTHIPTYQKSSDVFSVLEGRVEAAADRSERLFRHMQEVHEVNPSSLMHELVGFVNPFRLAA